jgi:hypothetical protein
MAKDSALSTYLVDAVEPVLHAFDGVIPTILHVLGFQHLTESTFPFLSHQSVFSHSCL